MRFKSVVIPGILVVGVAVGIVWMQRHAASTAQGPAVANAGDAFHDSASLERAPQYILSPDFVSAGHDPAFDLGGVSDVYLHDSGKFLATAYMPERVLLFDEHGNGVRIVARQGAGPGEFRRMSTFGRGGNDSVLLMDRANNRFTWLSATTGVLGSRPVPSLPHSVGGLAGVLPSGDIAVYASSWSAEDTSESFRVPMSLHVVGLNDSVTDLGYVPGPEMRRFETNFNGRKRSTAVPVRLTRSISAVVVDSFIAVSDPQGTGVDLRTRDGTVARRIVLDRARRPVTHQMRQRVIESELERLRGPLPERPIDMAESERMARERPFVDSLPALQRLLASSDGLLWLVDAIAPTDTGWSATAFTSDGRAARRLVADRSGIPYAFSANRVAVREEDEEGMVLIRIYRMVPRPAGAGTGRR